MSSAATVIGNLGTYKWNARVYDTLALASHLAVAVRNHGNTIRVAYHLYQLNDKVTEFIELVNSAMEGKVKPDPHAEPVTPVTLRSTADNFDQLYRTLDYIVEGSRRAGLMNNSLTAASVRGLQRHVEAIGNLADWFDLAAQPESINELFAIADREKERGELVDLSQFD